jgi:glyoxylase-like metal-dependent hydrolase (beta-lactamase superfamily II)
MTRTASVLFAALLIAAQAKPLPPWTPGTLDIHQIVTARGNAAFIRYPDGTALLIDAGDSGPSDELNGRPDRSEPAAGVIVRYLQRMLDQQRPVLHYALLTHFHPDHIGAFQSVVDRVSIDAIVDRGFEYLPPADSDQLFTGYRALVERLSARTRHVAAKAGAVDQVAARTPVDGFEARIVSVNDEVWTGRGDAAKRRFPAVTALAREDLTTENMCSVTLRVKYGAFDYFTGGDQPGYPVPGAPAWHDVESDVARAIGPTDVHVVNHHGSIEEENLFWLRTLRSQVMVVPAWAPTHPSPDVLKRMLSTRVYPDPRDIFITLFRAPTKATIGPRASQVASDRGHIVVRVEPGGSRFWIYVLDDTDAGYPIKLVKGPYASR